LPALNIITILGMDCANYTTDCWLHGFTASVGLSSPDTTITVSTQPTVAQIIATATRLMTAQPSTRLAPGGGVCRTSSAAGRNCSSVRVTSLMSIKQPADSIVACTHRHC
jgi:hypothetical protein